MENETKTNSLTTSRKDIFSAYIDDDDVRSIDVYKPFSNAVKLIDNTKVARTSKVENIDQLIKKLQVGQRLKLVREPNNLNDKNAVKITNQDGEKIGYVACDVNEIITRLLDGGKDVFAEITTIEQLGPWNKIDVGIYIDD